MYLVVMGRSSFCVVCVSVCGPVYALVNPIVMGRSCCVVCVIISYWRIDETTCGKTRATVTETQEIARNIV